MTTAPFPFNRPDADIILLSCDDVHFHVHRSTLELASPVIANMPTVPQAPKGNFSDVEDRGKNPLSVISLTEDGITLENILRFCYPTERPRMDRLEDARKVFEAATKYQMEFIQKQLRAALFHDVFVKSRPIHVFILACQYGFKDEAAIAATYTLRLPIRDIIRFPTHLYHSLSADVYASLLQYHLKCTDAAVACVAPHGNIYEWITHDDWVFMRCKRCEPAQTAVTVTRSPTARVAKSPRAWWMEYMQAAGQELRRRPCTDVITDDDFLNRYIAKAVQCLDCQQFALHEMKQFATLLADRVNKVISQVKLEIRL